MYYRNRNSIDFLKLLSKFFKFENGKECIAKFEKFGNTNQSILNQNLRLFKVNLMNANCEFGFFEKKNEIVSNLQSQIEWSQNFQFWDRKQKLFLQD